MPRMPRITHSMQKKLTGAKKKRERIGYCGESGLFSCPPQKELQTNVIFLNRLAVQY